MALRDEMKELIDAWKSNQKLLDHNKELFDIFEGDLVTSLAADLKRDMSEDTFKEIMSRHAPINVLKRLIDKLSKIYAKPPVRELSDGASELDRQMFADYLDDFEIDSTMGGSDGANGFFNMFKNCWLEPFMDEGEPRLRVIPSDRFFVYTKNKINPNCPTHFVKVMGKAKDASGMEHTVFHAYTKDEFLPFTDRETVLFDVLAETNNPDGINPLGALPGVYINRSKYHLMPKADTDTLTMTKLIPIFLSDLNYAIKYQCFSIVYTIDADQSNLTSAPNALWDLKSTPGSDKAPQVGVVKPVVDIDQGMKHIVGLLSMWMQTRNIKPGAIGDLSVGQSASGIAKAIDEMDTSEDRQAQVPYFIDAERKLWDLVFNHYHPLWIRESEFEFAKPFSNGLAVDIQFSQQRPILDSTKAITDQQTMIGMGIQTRRGALRELYPDWDDETLDARIAEVDAEKLAAKPTALMEPNANQTNPKGDGASLDAPNTANPSEPIEEVPPPSTSGGGLPQ